MPKLLRNSLALLCAFCMMAAFLLMFLDPAHIEAECFFFCVYGGMAALLLYHERDAD